MHDPVGEPAPTRTFIALALGHDARAAVEAASGVLRDAAGDAVRWTSTETLHVTVRFLGDVAPAALATLRRELATRTADCLPVDLRIDGAGAFPPRGQPRVVWLGLDAGPALAALHARVEDACAAAGLGREARPFRPHLTIGRPRAGPAAAAVEPALRAAMARVGFVAAERVASLHLMRSELTRTGARHTPIEVFPLVGGVSGPGSADSGSADTGAPPAGARPGAR
jgi:2'-5' RNA ligase